MKKYAKSFLILITVLALLLQSTALAVGTGEPYRDESVELLEGFTYRQTGSYNDKGQPVESYWLSSSVGSPVRPIVLAPPSILGGCTVSEIMAYAEGLGYNVLGAVNADFFAPANGVALGTVIEDGRLVTNANGENLLAFSDAGAFVSVKPLVTVQLTNRGGGADPSDAGKSVSLTYVNKPRGNIGGLYLLTPQLSAETPLTTSSGWYVKMRVVEGSFGLAETTTMRVEEVVTGNQIVLEEGCAVLTAADASACGYARDSFSVGDTVSLDISCTDERLLSARWAVSCGDLLVSGGAVTDNTGWDPAIQTRNPRTAVGIMEDGSVLCRIIDGRSVNSYGATMTELAEDFAAAGCQYAVNLDGGGSSVMTLRLPGSAETKTVNVPSVTKERKCGSYILFVTDAPESTEAGIAHRLFLTEEPYVLTGSSVQLSCIASDAFARPTEAPTDLGSVSSGLGSVTDGLYTAGLQPGDDIIVLCSASTGAVGTGTVHVVDIADKLTVTDAASGEAPMLENMVHGETVQLIPALFLHEQPVSFDSAAVTYSVTGDVGTVSETGLFTASDTPYATGTLTVSAGGQEAVIPVSILGYFADVEGHWAEANVLSLMEKGVVVGGGGLEYRPQEVTKRCDFVVMLWRAAGKPQPTSPSTFADVPEGLYYSDAVAWGQETGIVQGDGTLFEPMGTLLREHAFTFAYRYMTCFGGELCELDPAVLEAFADAASVSVFALDPVCALVAEGIVQGSDGQILPHNAISRAETAKLLDTLLIPARMVAPEVPEEPEALG